MSSAAINAASVPPQAISPAPQNVLLQRRNVLLIGCAALVILGSLGFYFFTRNPGTPNPYPPYTGTLALNDALDGNDITWPQGSGTSGGCNFIGGAYHAQASAEESHVCANGVSNYNDFTYQVDMSINEGNAGGILFRTDDVVANYYYFIISRNGSYEFGAVKSNIIQSLKQGVDQNINTGLKQHNEIGVVARGNTIDLYVNLHRIGSVNDSTYTSGSVGVGAFSSAGNPTDVAFNNAQVWKL